MTTFSLSPVETSSTALDELSAITSALAKSKAQIVLVGAGISTSAGIQDFRSPTGLYSNALPSTSRISPASFSSSVYSSPSTRSAHWKLIANLQEQSAASTPTKTHLFFNTLKSRGTLRRVYSQNIDGLEGKAGLAKVRVQGSVESGFSGGSDMGAKGKGKAKWEGEYVALHGDVHLCRCTGCAYVGRWDSKISEAFSRGETLDCPDCLEMAQLRILSQKRSPPLLTFLRPSIILYDESPPHSAPTTIAQVAQSDLNSKPDFVLVMGTSLKIPGFKDLVKQFAREVKSRGGIAVFVNGEKVAGKEWESVFDYQGVRLSCFPATVRRPKPRIKSAASERGRRGGFPSSNLGKDSSALEIAVDAPLLSEASLQRMYEVTMLMLPAAFADAAQSAGPAGGAPTPSLQAPACADLVALVALSHVNRLFNRISQKPLWEWVALRIDEKADRWCYEMLLNDPELWKHVVGLHLEVEPTAEGARFASLALSLGVRISHFNYTVLQPASGPTGEELFPTSLSNRLRKLPLRTINFRGFSSVDAVEDPTFHLIDDLPSLSNVAIDGVFFARQLASTKRSTLSNCQVRANRSMASDSYDDSESMWSSEGLDMLESSYDITPVGNEYFRTEDLVITGHAMFFDDMHSITPRIFRLLGKLSSLRELSLRRCGNFIWRRDWSLGTSLPNLIKLTIDATEDCPASFLGKV
ncbi:hypothetical protein P7C70_g133, partial [Phenoliferia sp. Uapishka_3]